MIAEEYELYGMVSYFKSYRFKRKPATVFYLRGDLVEKYNLDDKGGLFKFLVKNPNKLVKANDKIEMLHFSSFNPIRGTVQEVTDTAIKIKFTDPAADFGGTAGEHVILSYNPDESYVVTGDIGSVDSRNPLQITVKVHKIEKLKDLKKEKKLCVSLPGFVKIIGVAENRPIAVKNIGMGGIKFNAHDDILMEDFIEATVNLDKATKLSLKGRVIRKNKLNDLYEYGLEVEEMTESNIKTLNNAVFKFVNS